MAMGRDSRFINIHILSGQLWSVNKHTGLKKRNEDTFTSNVIIPILLATFSGFDNLISRWRGDVFRPGQAINIVIDTPNEFPDFSISYDLGTRKEYLLAMEIKPPNTTEQRLVDDEVKTANMTKKGLDSLLSVGYDTSIFELVVQGVDVYLNEMTLADEAVYLLLPHGHFKAPTSNLELALAFVMIPVLDRQRTAKLMGLQPFKLQSSSDDYTASVLFLSSQTMSILQSALTSEFSLSRIVMDRDTTPPMDSDLAATHDELDAQHRGH
ncbi:hypothetical protein EDD21DRAFT_350115 [Dissophora ornata]|nr:hypothetical protein BGZ58_010720 [Dissophora ornata]KAI8605318.1 hypothetical protein EDD21DRAFT_350115 [Dissophora ornata]